MHRDGALSPSSGGGFPSEVPAAVSARRLGRAGAAFTRLNERYLRACFTGIAISGLLHALYILWGPGPTSTPYQLRETRIEVVDIPDEIDVPAPPPEVERPPLPEVAELPLEPQVVDTPEETEKEEEPLPETTLDPLHPPVAPAPGVDEFVAFDSPPEAIHTTKPVYPEIARELNAEGLVRVQVTIDETGRVSEAVIVESDAISSLNDAALAAAKEWRFRPARQRDVPVKSRFVLPFRFRLRRDGNR